MSIFNLTSKFIRLCLFILGFLSASGLVLMRCPHCLIFSTILITCKRIIRSKLASCML